MCTSALLRLMAIALTAAMSAKPVPAADDLAARVRACAACHGPQGRAASDGYYPRIAGKPQEYLYRQLLNFRERRRSYAPMVHLVRNLSDDYLREIAGHFAALDLPYPPPRPGRTDPSALRLGETLVRDGDAARGLPSCASCHGTSLTGVLPGVPALLGLPRDYLVAQFGAWRHGLRSAPAPDCMARVARRLEARDVEALSQWLAAQPVPPQARPGEAPATTAGEPECAGLPDHLPDRLPDRPRDNLPGREAAR